MSGEEGERCRVDGCDGEPRWRWWNGKGAFAGYCDEHARDQLDEEDRCPITRAEDVSDGYVLPAGIQPRDSSFPTIRTKDAFDKYLETDGEKPRQCNVGWCSKTREQCGHDGDAKLRADGGQVEDGYAGWVCDGCGKHITNRHPGGECTDCGGSWLPANEQLLACDRCGDRDASSVLNSEHNRLCDDCLRWENVTLDAYEYDKDDVFQGMDGDFWVVTARLWNHDATEYERSSPTGEKFETTMPWHRREYELAKLDPAAMGTDKQRVNEQELTSYFSASTKESAREYYEEVDTGDEDA